MECVSAARVRRSVRASSWSNRLAPGSTRGGGVEYNVVEHAVGIGIGDETVIRPIVGEGRSEIKSDETEVVPSFSASVVQKR